MPTLLIGPVNSLAQNVVYALPARKVRVQSDKTVEVGQDGSNFVALTGANTVGGVDCAAAFLRSTNSGTTLVTCKV